MYEKRNRLKIGRIRERKSERRETETIMERCRQVDRSDHGEDNVTGQRFKINNFKELVKQNEDGTNR